MVRNDVGALSGDGNSCGGGGGGGGGEGGAALFRFEERHYRVLETLALPGAEDAPVRQTQDSFVERVQAYWTCAVTSAPACWPSACLSYLSWGCCPSFSFYS